MGKRLLLSLILLALNLLIHPPAWGEDSFLSDEVGRRVKVPHFPKRVVSLAPSITEVLFALGLHEEIIGVTSFCDYPEEARHKPRVGEFVAPSVEKIVSLRPDFIIAIQDGNRGETIDRLNHLGLPVYVIDPKGIEGIWKTIHQLGKVLGKEEESKRLLSQMTKRKDEIVYLTKSLDKPKVFFQMGVSPLVTAGPKTLADDLMRLAGGRNIAEGETTQYPVYDIESVMLKDPDIIIMSSMGGKKDHSNLVQTWQNWKSITAVKKKAVYAIDSNIVDRPTPRIIEGLEAMVGAIHPELLKKEGGPPQKLPTVANERKAY